MCLCDQCFPTNQQARFTCLAAQSKKAAIYAGCSRVAAARKDLGSGSCYANCQLLIANGLFSSSATVAARNGEVATNFLLIPKQLGAKGSEATSEPLFPEAIALRSGATATLSASSDSLASRGPQPWTLVQGERSESADASEASCGSAVVAPCDSATSWDSRTRSPTSFCRF